MKATIVMSIKGLTAEIWRVLQRRYRAPLPMAAMVIRCSNHTTADNIKDRWHGFGVMMTEEGRTSNAADFPSTAEKAICQTGMFDLTFRTPRDAYSLETMEITKQGNVIRLLGYTGVNGVQLDISTGIIASDPMDPLHLDILWLPRNTLVSTVKDVLAHVGIYPEGYPAGHPASMVVRVHGNAVQLPHHHDHHPGFHL